MFFDLTKAKAELGWTSTKSNEEMLIESYDWYVANRTEVLSRTGASHHRSAVRTGILRILEYLP